MRISTADSADLAVRENVDLVFARGSSPRLGVVVAARQSLLTTFLFYQALAYLGPNAGAWLAQLTRARPEALEQSQSMGRLLGGIDVQLRDGADGWRTRRAPGARI